MLDSNLTLRWCVYVRLHPATRETKLGIFYAATDITKNSGVVRVVLGSNNWNDTRDPRNFDETLVELKMGDTIMWYVTGSCTAYIYA